MSKQKKPKLVPASVVRYPDGRLRGLVLADSDWWRLQLKVGDHVIAETNRGDVLAGEVVLRDGLKMVRAPVDEMDAKHPIYVRRPLR